MFYSNSLIRGRVFFNEKVRSFFFVRRVQCLQTQIDVLINQKLDCGYFECQKKMNCKYGRFVLVQSTNKSNVGH